MTFFADLLGTLFERRSVPPTKNAYDTDALASDITKLLSGVGDISGIRIAQNILSQYQGMDEAAKRTFFTYLTDKLDLDTDRLIEAARAYQENRTARTLQALTHEAEPQRQELLRRLNQAPDATHWLVEMRHDLLRLIKDAPELAVIDTDFQHLFASWFNRGFLVLRQIDWHTPANILEKIIEYEAVHAIDDWQDLRRRLLPEDRRCFAFFHPAMPEEPLIFVEVALCQGIPGSVQALLDDETTPVPDDEADTAVFYSISNCQQGLRGISFGNLLIKQVVEELAAELPGLGTFVTLSPVPGFNRWLKNQEDTEPQIVSLLEQLESRDEAAVEAHEGYLRSLCAEYLLECRTENGKPCDPVARFHLGNGAQLHDIHVLADNSVNGWDQSSTLMVNYLYDLTQVNRNSERYTSEAAITASRQVQQLVRKDRTGKTT